MSATSSASYGRYAVASAKEDVWDGYRRSIRRRDAGRGRVWLYPQLLMQLSDRDGAIRMADDALAHSTRSDETQTLVCIRVRALRALRRFEEGVETFNAYGPSHPDWDSPILVSAVLDAYSETGRRADGIRDLRALAGRHPGSPLATAIRIALRRRVELCSTSEPGPDGRLTQRGLELARAQARWRSPAAYLIVITDGTPAASATVACFGLRVPEVDRRLAGRSPRGDATASERGKDKGGPPSGTSAPDHGQTPPSEAHQGALMEAVRSAAASLPDGGSALMVMDSATMQEFLAWVQWQRGVACSAGWQLGPCQSAFLHFEGASVVEVTLPPTCR